MTTPLLVITGAAPALPRTGTRIQIKETGCNLDGQLVAYFNPLGGSWLFGAEGIHCEQVVLTRQDKGLLRVTGLTDAPSVDEPAPAPVTLVASTPLLVLEGGRLASDASLVAALDQRRSHSAWVAGIGERYHTLLIEAAPAVDAA